MLPEGEDTILERMLSMGDRYAIELLDLPALQVEEKPRIRAPDTVLAGGGA